MNLEASLLILAATIIVGLIAYIWNDRNHRQAEDKISPAAHAKLTEKVEQLERNYHLLHEWKRTLLPMDLDNRGANIRDYVDRVEKRVERIERKLFNGHRE